VGVVGATGVREISRGMVSERASQRAFFGVSALLFTASATVTIVWCASMSAPAASNRLSLASSFSIPASFGPRLRMAVSPRRFRSQVAAKKR
jgi:hypothetical protein